MSGAMLFIVAIPATRIMPGPEQTLNNCLLWHWHMLSTNGKVSQHFSQELPLHTEEGAGLLRALREMIIWEVHQYFRYRANKIECLTPSMLLTSFLLVQNKSEFGEHLEVWGGDLSISERRAGRAGPRALWRVSGRSQCLWDRQIENDKKGC